ncbi:MAG: peptidoglycan DD-metalloendopeptidase family protein [Kovacikia sp.]
MTSYPLPANYFPRSLQHRFLTSGISLVSALAILSGSSVWAQASDLSVEPASVESAPVPSAVPPSDPSMPAEMAAPALSLPEGTPLAPIRGGTSEGAVPPPGPDASERYIDSTAYSVGATQRSSEVAARAMGVPSLPSTVQGGVMPGSSYSVTFGQTAPSIKDYYFRTLRPPGVLGNGNIRLIFPLPIPAPITSLFGWRNHPITGAQSFHSGTDLGAPMGTPVLAAYAGRVAIADLLGGYGLAVVVDHNKNTQQTLYGHLSEIFVKPGEWVKQGVAIGRVGSTGLSTGPHLHFEFRQLTPEGWVALDPGTQLEYALAQLIKTMGGVAQLPANSNAVETLQLDLSANLDVNLQDRS